MVFNHPSFLPLTPFSSTCDNITENGSFGVSRVRQFAAVLLFTVFLTTTGVAYTYQFPFQCHESNSICLHEVAQLMYILVGFPVIIYGHLKPKCGTEFLTEWYKILENDDFICANKDLVKRNCIYSTILILMSPISAVLSSTVWRDGEVYTSLLRSIFLAAALNLQQAAIYKHGLIMKFIETVYRNFGKKLQVLLEENEEHRSTSNLEEELQNLRKHYSLLENNTRFITHSNGSKFLAWLGCIMTVVGINIYNLVLAWSNGFQSISDMAIPFETYGLIAITVYVIKCAQQLSEAVRKFCNTVLE